MGKIQRKLAIFSRENYTIAIPNFGKERVIMFEKLLERFGEFAANAGTKLFWTVLLVVAGLLVIRIVMTVLNGMMKKTGLDKAAHSLIRSVVRVLLYVLLCLMAASSLGIDVTGVVALASVLTLAVSLALQNILANVIGGFTILSTHPFRVGDYVEINGQGGTVSDINMTYTELMTPDMKKISIPNNTVVAAQVTNFSTSENRRINIDVTASYNAPTQKVLDALVQASAMDRILADPAPQAVILGYGDSAISYSIRVWVKNADYWDVYFKLMQNVKNVFDENGIEMTYPHLNVHLDR